jgi:hypothetical protein
MELDKYLPIYIAWCIKETSSKCEKIIENQPYLITGRILSPGVEVIPGGEILSVFTPPFFFTWGVNEEVNIPPRVLIAPRGAKFTHRGEVKNGPCLFKVRRQLPIHGVRGGLVSVLRGGLRVLAGLAPRPRVMLLASVLLAKSRPGVDLREPVSAGQVFRANPTTLKAMF